MLPGTISGMKHVCYFRHALALDERRVKFLPEFAYGGSTKPPPKLEKEKASPGDHESGSNDRNTFTRDADVHDITTRSKPSDDEPPIDDEALDVRSSAGIKSIENHPQTIEVWFAGTHSDM
jgi:hypothetical protein